MTCTGDAAKRGGSGFPGKLALAGAALLLSIGGCVFDPAARADLVRLRKAYEVVETQAVAIGKDLRAVEDAILQARDEKEWTRLSSLLPVAKGLREKLSALNQQRIEAASAIKALIQEHEVPGWQVALYALGLLVGGGGTAGLAARVKWLAPARLAIRRLTHAIEEEGATPVKARVAKHGDPEIERAVSKLQGPDK